MGIFTDICLDKWLKENKDNTYLIHHEKLEHDGYDYHGAKSNLWDLYIFYKTKSSDEVMIDFYHREDWFDSKNEHYSYWGTYTLKEFKNGNANWCRSNRSICEKLGF
jgi:hypothetical protein